MANIHLVSDSQALLKLLRGSLNQSGWRVETFLEFKLWEHSSNPPDLLILDLDIRPRAHWNSDKIYSFPILVLTSSENEVTAHLPKGALAYPKSLVRTNVSLLIQALLFLHTIRECAHDLGNAVAMLDGLHLKLRKALPAESLELASLGRTKEKVEHAYSQLKQIRQNLTSPLPKAAYE